MSGLRACLPGLGLGGGARALPAAAAPKGQGTGGRAEDSGIPDDVLHKALQALAAKASRWVYEPACRHLPYVIRIDGVRYAVRCRVLSVVLASGDEQAQKGVAVVSFQRWAGREPAPGGVRILLHAFRGTVRFQDWLANMGVTRNQEAFADYGLDVHSAWHAMAYERGCAEPLSKLLMEEGEDEEIDWVLLCGHSTGGALAQVAALRALKHVEQGHVPAWIARLLTERLRCITVAAPVPFAPVRRPVSPEVASRQTAALCWLKSTCLNYVHNNDMVPRLPENIDFLESFLQSCGRVVVGVGPRIGCQAAIGVGYPVAILDLLQALRRDAAILKSYRATARHVFLGHRRGARGTEPFDPHTHAFAEEILRGQPADPGAPPALGWTDWYTGGLAAVVNDHSVDLYIDRVYEACNTQDHLHGRGFFIGQRRLTKRTYRDGAKYLGETLNGKHHGVGIISWPDGSQHEGEWVAGACHGEGIRLWPNGSRYEGEWLEDKRSGHGTQLWPGGSCYEGEWCEDKRHGRGIYCRLDGSWYEGEWRDGRRHGQGVHTWPDGSVYEGAWRHDCSHGPGALTVAPTTPSQGDASRRRLQGEWVNGELVKASAAPAPKADGRPRLPRLWPICRTIPRVCSGTP